ncbi:carboxypeptidase-like regulatory domain-containing protein [Marivirga sp. S37H4]|uniref:Carboxypeptidase-like regulatory domain-containing protein n=1 Tax=Marivirga aurantiaca TaxID=2802615 RepID=A0A934X1T3_9BACT|nr:carboxypeptidase-like regulatory domain-containing protein [Marivirga aurantiaca]MBK6267428.1 carboxypeptidase-like regulatory domain-containing protein [Marivirga aurantiaca]
MRNILLVLLLVFTIFSALGQTEEAKPIHLTGVILDAENLEPVPFTSVLIDAGKRGTVADNTGYFSFLAYPGDTITFRSVGYESRDFIIPEILEGDTYSLIELLVRENIILEEVVVSPLPEMEDFAETMLKQELTDLQKVKINEFKKDLNQILNQQHERDKYYYEQWRYAKLYDMTGIVPPNNFLNPLTWSNFIRDWRSNQNKD